MYVTLQNIYQAQANLVNITRKTPIIYSEKLSSLVGAEIYLKLENIQVTGSFKVRGAFNKVSALTKDKRANGVVAFSAGNHGAGTAYAASKMGVPCLVVMPDVPNEDKKQSILSYGAEVVPGGMTSVEMFKTAVKLVEERGMTLIHPFNDLHIIAGQGTVGNELMKQLPDVDVVVCAVSGGGLISGVAAAVKETKPRTQMIGVNTEGAQAMYQSLANDRVTEVEEVNTIADGLMAKEPGELTFNHTKKYVDDMVLVSEEKIKETVGIMAKETKTIVEPSGAAALAALLEGKVSLEKNQKVCVIVSGGNAEKHLYGELFSSYY
ncbi:threonine ammonia-lyase [Siminovitchia fortis]|uniref:threonine ammonia-lyase n=1 Tax=Siminovitchia fortis TaxID=254758 RepID=UPI00119E4238|nr:threonine/serine dehydratase [Siminovitchia fortis]